MKRQNSFRSSVVSALLIALFSGGCAHGPPTAKNLETTKGRQKAVILVRVLTETNGRSERALPPGPTLPGLWLGLGDFSSGGKLSWAELRFLSSDTRKDGWTYLLLEPGIYYLGPLAADLPMDITPLPFWRLEVPRKVPILYAGTLFVPRRGDWPIPFDSQRFEMRDESALAQEIHQAWLTNLGPISSHLVFPHKSSEPFIFETPQGK